MIGSSLFAINVMDDLTRTRRARLYQEMRPLHLAPLWEVLHALVPPAAGLAVRAGDLALSAAAPAPGRRRPTDHCRGSGTPRAGARKSRAPRLLGDAAHPMLQYLAQGACMALEDAVTLGAAFRRYEQARIARTARVTLSAREMGRLYHAKGVERLVRNSLWRGRAPERFYDSLEWLYGWTADACLPPEEVPHARTVVCIKIRC